MYFNFNMQGSRRVMAAAGEERAADLMLKCVEEGRVDVLCSILSQLSEYFLDCNVPFHCSLFLNHRESSISRLSVVILHLCALKFKVISA